VKFVEPHPFSDPETAARKLMEIANSVEPVQDGRIHIELINGPFQTAHEVVVRRFLFERCAVMVHYPC
jgi:hypothetical protein